MEYEIKNGCLLKYNGEGPDVVIPEGVTKISINAFLGFKNCNRLTLPTSLKFIESGAFGSSSRFLNVHVASLEAWMDIKKDDSPLDYNSTLYIDGQALENLIVPQDVNRINVSCFERCASLKRVEISGPATIDRSAFSGCKQLEEVILSDDIPKIESSAFCECMSLAKINLPSGIKKIESHTFRWCHFSEITIPDGVKEIESGAFELCKNLKQISIPASVSKIGSGVFNGCDGLKSVTLSEGLKSIGGDAFSRCTSLKEISIPSTVTQIAATSLPYSLEKITIRCKLSAFDPKAFKRLESIESVYISEEQVEQAKKLIKKVKWFNLDGEPITKVKKSTSSRAATASKDKSANSPAVIPGKPGEMAVTYPSDVPAPTAPLDLYAVSKGQPKGFTKPPVKEIHVHDGKNQFTVTLKFASKYASLWKRYYLEKDSGALYDPKSALMKAEHKAGYIDDKTGNYIASSLITDFPEDLEALSPDMIENRLESFVTICNRCILKETVQSIVKAAQKKKDGKLYKGRVLHLTYLSLLDVSGTTCELVAKNDDELQLSIELRNNVPVNDDLLRQEYLF